MTMQTPTDSKFATSSRLQMTKGLGNIKSRDLSIGYDGRSVVNTKKAATLTKV